jgi:hypothetical protein
MYALDSARGNSSAFYVHHNPEPLSFRKLTAVMHHACNNGGSRGLQARERQPTKSEGLFSPGLSRIAVVK